MPWFVVMAVEPSYGIMSWYHCWAVIWDVAIEPPLQLGRHSLLRLLISKMMQDWTFKHVGFGMAAICLFWCEGVSPQRTELPEVLHLFNPQMPRASEEKGVWRPHLWSGVCIIHTFGFLHNRWHGLTWVAFQAWCSSMASLYSLLFVAKTSIRGSRSISFRQSDASPELGLVSGPEDY